jgi:hypothetical protein
MFNLNDLDVVGISLSGSYAEGIGATGGIELLYFLDGVDKGKLFSYSYVGALIGGAAGGGLSIIGANFLGTDNRLSSDDFWGYLILILEMLLVEEFLIFGVIKTMILNFIQVWLKYGEVIPIDKLGLVYLCH